MAVKYIQEVFRTREEAEAHQEKPGIRGYSEEYGEGIYEVTLDNGEIGYLSKKKVYYG